MYMEKKEGTNITIQQMRELVARESWVKTPYRYTQLGAGLSLVQQQALLSIWISRKNGPRRCSPSTC